MKAGIPSSILADGRQVEWRRTPGRRWLVTITRPEETSLAEYAAAMNYATMNALAAANNYNAAAMSGVGGLGGQISNAIGPLFGGLGL